jgi:hypothetical protein
MKNQCKIQDTYTNFLRCTKRKPRNYINKNEIFKEDAGIQNLLTELEEKGL